ncbi:type II toxin-antitoxin system RelE/ParE family toxin [Teichococcus vastitatis]|uniref:Type II toxin-antitoxin system RelE/ParE family toxin n=1 Tax=Teichococcus vastitatis TaxID=2307076 RepID=A0ABS9WAH4_9PROT|nr:type II toxin-antitoxin system RelE/ParE family toxin [Pseudoroseomonas vastitatis]MCI0755993.1 type II toxin-antitoxin system RelE/ParE family toxin [Pseudoroseomonas vastitatis]
MASLFWLPEAVADLERLLLFLHGHNPEAAGRAARAIARGADRLAVNAALGRPLADGTERRELLVPFASGAYVLRYRRDGGRDAVVVIRVWHSREERRPDQRRNDQL